MKRLWCLGLIAALSLCGWAAKPVSEQVLLYPSVDQFGQTITLSGKVSIPRNRTAKGIILVTHYTIYSLEEAPSVAKVAKGIESKMFYKDYILGRSHHPSSRYNSPCFYPSFWKHSYSTDSGICGYWYLERRILPFLRQSLCFPNLKLQLRYFCPRFANYPVL